MLRNVCWHKDASKVYEEDDRSDTFRCRRIFLEKQQVFPEEISVPVIPDDTCFLRFLSCAVSRQVLSFAEHLPDADPLVSHYRTVLDAKPSEVSPQFICGICVSLSLGREPPFSLTCGVVDVNQPQFSAFLADIRPKFR